MPYLDIERTFPGLNKKEVLDVLGRSFDTITTGVRKPFKTGQDSGYVGPKNMAKSLQRHREFHFKSADAQIDYMKDLGQGNLFKTMLAHLDRSARSVSMMETFGPNPEYMLDSLIKSKRLSLKEGNLPQDIKVKRINDLKGDIIRRKGAIGRAYSVVSGDVNVPHNLLGAKIGVAVRTQQTLAKLGKAAISSVNDIFTVAMNIRFQGANFLESWGEALKIVFGGRTSQEQKIIAYELGAMFDGMIGDVVNRFDYQDTFNGNAAAMTDKFFRMTGLTQWTDRLKAGFARSTSVRMAMNALNSFRSLDHTYRTFMEMHGIYHREWEIYRTMAKRQADGRNYILPESIDDVGDDAIARYLADDIEKAKKNRTFDDKRFEQMKIKARNDLRTKLMAFYADEIDHAVLTPQARTKATLTRGWSPGTWEGEFARTVTQFKSFPFAFYQMFLKGGRFGQAGKPIGGADVSQLIVASLAFGYASMTMKDIVVGKKAKSPLKIETWMQAALQGGGAGIYGDLLFSKVNRYGGGVAETVVGPGLATAFEGIGQVQSGLRAEFDPSSLYWLAQNNAPFVNMWWSKAALDYLIGYNIQEWLNPGTLGRRERRLKKEFGQEFIVPPTDVIQRGGGFR